VNSWWVLLKLGLEAALEGPWILCGFVDYKI